MRILNQQEAEDILYGASVLAAGGGGNFDAGLELIRGIYRNGNEVKIVHLDEVEDDWFIASPYYIGSVVPPQKDVEAKLEIYKEHVSTIAALALQSSLRRKLDAVLAAELGANIAWAMEVAASLNIPLIDADPAGRGVPKLDHTTFNLHGVSIAPFALSNKYGEVLIVQSVAGHDRAEEHARAFALSSGNSAGICDHPIDGEKLKKSVIGGTIQNSEQMGRVLRLAKYKGNSPVDIMLEVGNGNLLIEGVISSAAWEDKIGFIEGTVAITSFERNKTLNLKFRNEFMYAESEGEIISIIPEVITVINLDTGLPILNPSCKEGMKVAVLTFPAPEIWESEQGLSLFGPEYIGLDKEIYSTIKENKGVKKREIVGCL